MTYNEFLKKVRDAARVKASEVPKFRGMGCIRITVCPCCEEADKWLGGLSVFRERNSDVAEYESVFSIVPGGSHTAVFDDVRVNTYGFSALKVAQCSQARKEGAGLLSGIRLEGRDLVESNGWAAYLGALCMEIKYDNGDDYMRIYVSVSGANQEDDLKCAFAGAQVARTLLKDDGFRVKMPIYPSF